MLKELTYKKKNLLLLAGTGFFILISWYMAFGKTLSVYQDCKVLEEKLVEASDAPMRSAALRKKLAEMDQLLGDRQLTDTNTQQALLDLITNYCQNSKTVLREFPKTISKQDNDYTVETNVFTVEGEFSKLLRLVYLLEQKERLGKVASVLFRSKRDLRTKVLSLNASIYVQNIKKNNNAN